MTTAILTPFDFSDPVPAGRRRFWKQVLPNTQIDYQGQKIDFNNEFHTDLAEAFTQKAYDQVPLVFADAGNRHNMDPRNFAGEVVKVENRGKDGTWALIEADRAAAKAINQNPKLGVSARIMQGIAKADGRTFKRALNHVLLTMNPRVQGMQPWQAVDLSGDTETDEVVDLTAEEYKEGNAMGKQRTATRRQIDLSALSDDDFATLVDLATEAGVLDDEEVDEDEEAADTGDVEDTSTATKKPTKKKSTTKVKVEKEVEGGDPDEDEEEEEEEDEESTDLSDAATTDQTNSTVRQMQVDLAEERWSSERKDLTLAGVPPFLLDLAEPVLSSPDTMVIDLADGETHNATDTIRKMLDGFKGIVDLTPDIGHSFDLSDEVAQVDADSEFIQAWEEQYG